MLQSPAIWQQQHEFVQFAQRVIFNLTLGSDMTFEPELSVCAPYRPILLLEKKQLYQVALLHRILKRVALSWGELSPNPGATRTH